MDNQVTMLLSLTVEQARWLHSSLGVQLEQLDNPDCRFCGDPRSEHWAGTGHQWIGVR